MSDLRVFRPTAYRPAHEYKGEPMIVDSFTVELVDNEEKLRDDVAIGLYDKDGRQVAVMPLGEKAAEQLDVLVAQAIVLMQKRAGAKRL